MSGGLKNEKKALSHRGMLLRLYPIFGSVENFWHHQSLNDWVKDEKKRKMAPGTIKTYLGSICFFVEFVRDEKHEPWGNCIKDITDMIPR